MPEKISVLASSGEYNVIIGSNLDYGALALEVKKPCKAAIISDDIVFSLYGEKTVKSLEKAGYSVSVFIIKNGEASKTLEQTGEILNFFAKEGLTRSDIAFALGGGVVGDITGFASAIYLRSIDYIQLPTTLLAAIDSSVGGKTAVDLALGKNLVGAFHQPIAVFCDTENFKTLPKEVFSDGISEAIKYGIIADNELFDMINSENLDITALCKTCVSIKAKIVESDEFDTGLRQILNFGHTVGHAVEHLSDFKISHGSAVAIGMMIITKSCEKQGITSENCSNRLEKALKKYNLPTQCNFSPKEITSVSMRDKKRQTNSITLVIPKKIGKCELYKISIKELEKFIEKGCN